MSFLYRLAIWVAGILVCGWSDLMAVTSETWQNTAGGHVGRATVVGYTTRWPETVSITLRRFLSTADRQSPCEQTTRLAPRWLRMARRSITRFRWRA